MLLLQIFLVLLHKSEEVRARIVARFSRKTRRFVCANVGRYLWLIIIVGSRMKPENPRIPKKQLVLKNKEC